jgi:hypothetical protein
MTTPDDARNALRAMLNQIPDTMAASHIVLNELAALGSVRGDDGDISVEKLHKIVGRWMAAMTACITTLENRVQRLEGRPGIGDDMIDSCRSSAWAASPLRTISRTRASVGVVISQISFQLLPPRNRSGGFAATPRFRR